MSYNPREMWISVLKPELRIISDELWQKAKNRQRYIEAKSEGKYHELRFYILKISYQEFAFVASAEEILSYNWSQRSVL